MQVRLASGELPSLCPQPGHPLPPETVPAGAAPTVAVAARPPHPGNTVLVLVRSDGGPAQIMAATAEAAESPQEQWFRALLPPVEAGRRLDYRAELVRSGQRLAALPADGTWLSLAGEPGLAAPEPRLAPVAPAPGPAATPHWAYHLDFLGTFSATGRLEVIGETPEGYRINFLIDRGRVAGPGLDARIHPGGGDWIRIRRDGVGALGIRATFETADGALTFYEAGGVLDLGAQGYDQVAGGRLRGDHPFYATPKFSTAHPRWQWLNRLQGLGWGRVMLDELRLVYDVYVPRVLDPPGD